MTKTVIIGMALLGGCFGCLGISDATRSQNVTNSSANVIVSPTPVLASTDQWSLNKAKWEHAGIKNYIFTLKYEGHGATAPASPVVIEVRNGQPYQIRPLVKTDTRRLGEYDGVLTVEGLFETIKEFEARNQMKVRYDSEYGYPIEIDGGINPDKPAHNFFNFTILEFKKL